MKTFYLYIMASDKNGTLYTGVTGNLAKRVYTHKHKLIDGFTKKYSTDKLVYVEVYEYVHDAITREHRIKKWRREWKLNLIEKQNPEWDDLYYKILWV